MWAQLNVASREFVHLQLWNKSGKLLPKLSDLLVQMLKVVRKYVTQQRKEFGAS
jgi:hypothetical protein